MLKTDQKLVGDVTECVGSLLDSEKRENIAFLILLSYKFL